MVEVPLIEIREPGRPVQRIAVDRVVEIGRSPDGITLSDVGVSRRHLKLTPSPLGLSAVDMGSRNGSLLNGLPLTHRQIVEPGDVLRIGATDILVVRQHAPVREPARVGGPRPEVTAAALPAPPPAPVVVTVPNPLWTALVRLFTGAPSPAGQPVFRNFMELPRRLPTGFWHGVRLISVLTYLALCVAMFVWPTQALFAFFKVVVPLLPILFFVAPGLWRNICPLAAANQAARVFGFSRAATTPGWLQRHGYLIAIGLFFGIAGARLALFNASGSATGILLAVTIVNAFIMGIAFKGKSGWCSSICPLLPLQRVYGQTPFLLVANTHCNPCVSCTRHCYDFKPQPAYQADLADPDPSWSRPRRLFAAALPGFVLGFYLLLGQTQLGDWHLYGRLALFVLGSVGALFVLIALIPVLEPVLVAVWGAVAISLFYWFGADVLAGSIHTLFGVDATVIRWPVRCAVIALAAIWVSRTVATHRRYLAVAAPEARPPVALTLSVKRSQPAGGSGAAEHGGADARGTATAATAVRFGADGAVVAAEPGMSVLETAERAGKEIEAGCRMGVCGADPIAVLDGAPCLVEPDEDELNTLRRLGFAANTRMACCARLTSGTVTVSLTPEPGGGPGGGERPATFDRSIASVVVVGNGIAGVTAADFVRRGHPDCEIHLVGAESHVLYNRMGISRLVYGRSAMTGLSLLAEEWYADNGITAWLNTIATAVDTAARRVDLGTGESLYYDRLILATGSSSAVPTLPGFGASGTFVMRSAADAMEIRRYAQLHRARTAVVAGGGLLGLEAAFALHALGLQVVVLERGARLMTRQLDERASALVDAHFRRLGMTVLYRAESASLQIADGAVRAVALTDGRVVPCEMFLAAVGIRPNADIAVRAGIACSKGVLVDDRMQSSIPGVFAAGDVAEHGGLVLGLWPIAAKQGETAAVNALGGDQRLVAEIPATILKGVDLELSSVGQVEPGPGDEVIVTEGPQSYRRLVISRGTLVGAIVIGHHPEDLAAASAAVRKRQLLDAWALSELRSGRWDVLKAQGRTLVGAGRRLS
jgi:NADPH-dependent 2,4-dienoyl-CoA reductase/sulfur reductase-like enzyme/ferredoxin